jgi:type IV fimbrial biogenesis protein FimT
MQKLPSNFQRGFGLIEALTSLAVGVIVLTAAAPGLQDVVARRHLEGVADRLAADLHFVRTEALARNASVRIAFHTDASGSCYLIHTGSPASCNCTAGTSSCSDGAVLLRSVAIPIAHAQVRANVESILFDPLHGTASPGGTLRVTGVSGAAVHHVINVLGRVRSCSTAGLGGHPAC